VTVNITTFPGVAPLPFALNSVVFTIPPVGATVALKGPETLKLKVAEWLPFVFVSTAVHNPAWSRRVEIEAVVPSADTVDVTGALHTFLKQTTSCASGSIPLPVKLTCCDLADICGCVGETAWSTMFVGDGYTVNG
jgi:hypothetical protein